MDYNIDRYGYQKPASRITVLAHLFGIIALILLLVWLMHYRPGFDLDSNNPQRVFDIHPFLMFFGFIFFAGEAAMAYKTISGERQVKKLCHMFFNLVAIVLGIVGIYAIFKFHNMMSWKHMRSLHSWIGMGTFCFFGLQWLFGFTVFLFPKGDPSTRTRVMPWHISAGRALLYMAICAAETGLIQLDQTAGLNESRIINFTGLAILLFGITVDLSVALARYT